VSSLRYHTRINRPADEVWKVVNDAGSIADWFPGIEKSSISGNIRTLEMGPGITLEEEVVNSDDTLRRFQYSIMGGPFVPEYHLGTVDVIEDGDASLVVYGTEIRPDDLAAVVGPAIEAAVVALKAHLEA
jgi:hypothetical protein